jgi:uncharacterized protein YpmS
LILFLSIASLLLFTPCVKAELDVDEYFEKSRGELIGFYGSEIVSHVALILGFLVAGAALASRVDDFLNNQKPLLARGLIFIKPSRAKRWTFVILLGLILCLVFYAGVRLVFWSAMGAYIIRATPENTKRVMDTNITSSNATSWTPILQDSAIKELANETKWWYRLALQSTSPEGAMLLLLDAFAFYILIVIILLVLSEVYQETKLRKGSSKKGASKCGEKLQ